MKKGKAIAIFCLLFIILVVFVTCSSYYANKKSNEKDIILAASVQNNDTLDGGTTNKYTVTYDGNETFTNTSDSSITCKSSSKTMRDNLVTKTKVTVINNGKTTSAMGCVYSASLTTPSPVTCNVEGSIYVEFVRNNLRIFLCSDPIANNNDSNSNSTGSTNNSGTAGNTGNTGSNNNQSDTEEEDNGITGGGIDSGTSSLDERPPRLEYDNMCASEGFKTASKIGGIVILIAKWVAPLILIIMGMIDFFKAIISSNDKSLSDATTTFIKRMVIAIVIPFIPGIIFYLIDFLIGEEVSGIKIEFGDCTKCLKEPLNDDCKVELYDYNNQK